MSGRFEPIRADASQQIAERLRAYLEQSGLQPGDRVGTEQELAREFGVSRPTLREGLRLLSGSHLIRVSRGRAGGVFVANSANDGMGRNVSQSIATMLAANSVTLHQLLDARTFLEVPIAGLAAEHVDDALVAAMEAAIQAAIGHDPTAEVFSQADASFHRALAESAGNNLLVAFTSWTLDVLQPSLIAYVGPAIEAEAIIADHRAIQRAVVRRQPAAARRAMAAHIDRMRDLVRKLDGELSQSAG
ncbi:MAG TPA: FCD domain-containing protein [Gaiellales bacterium]|jgi:DNA-binding FadR family transcriptional regulator